MRQDAPNSSIPFPNERGDSWHPPSRQGARDGKGPLCGTGFASHASDTAVSPVALLHRIAISLRIGLLHLNLHLNLNLNLFKLNLSISTSSVVLTLSKPTLCSKFNLKAQMHAQRNPLKQCRVRSQHRCLNLRP